MKTVIVFFVLGGYLTMAVMIARLCAVNADWERIARKFPRNVRAHIFTPDTESDEARFLESQS